MTAFPGDDLWGDVGDGACTPGLVSAHRKPGAGTALPDSQRTESIK